MKDVVAKCRMESESKCGQNIFLSLEIFQEIIDQFKKSDIYYS